MAFQQPAARGFSDLLNMSSDGGLTGPDPLAGQMARKLPKIKSQSESASQSDAVGSQMPPAFDILQSELKQIKEQLAVISQAMAQPPQMGLPQGLPPVGPQPPMGPPPMGGPMGPPPMGGPPMGPGAMGQPGAPPPGVLAGGPPPGAPPGMMPPPVPQVPFGPGPPGPPRPRGPMG